MGSSGDHPILEKPEFRAPAAGDYWLTDGSPGAGGGYPLLPVEEERVVTYTPGTRTDLPEVGPSPEAAAEALSTDPVHQEESLPPSSYHRTLVD